MSASRRLLNNTLRSLLLAPVAVVLLFEEWGWVPLAAAFAQLGRLPFWARLERAIVNLPPRGAVLAFFIPVIGLVPIKLLALYLFGEGHLGSGLALLIAAKLAGTAIAARLFQLTQPTLMQVRWFARLYTRWKRSKDRILSSARRSWPWRVVRRLKVRLRFWGRTLRAAFQQTGAE